MQYGIMLSAAIKLFMLSVVMLNVVVLSVVMLNVVAPLDGASGIAWVLETAPKLYFYGQAKSVIKSWCRSRKFWD
jgi:hypothetical protein